MSPRAKTRTPPDPDQPKVRWVTDAEYAYRCAVCGAPAWVQALEGDLLCQTCLRKRRRGT
jgi:DNA-directed RNA polymerase subunit RPC12/RpoP